MAKRQYEDLSQTARHKLVALSLLRSAGAVTVLVTLYYLAPLDRPLDAASGIRFVVGLLALAGIFVWQLRAIVESEIPRLRAIELLAVGLPLLLLLYASAYVVISKDQAGSFSENLGQTNALYFTLTVFTTVGFGDIVPVSELARIVTMTQMLAGLVAVGLVAKIVLGAVQIAVQRRPGGQGDPPAPGRWPRNRDGHAAWSLRRRP
ncbi:MAG TPA: potassium channel family protein [Pseudonocardiaceae bacterium]